MLTESGVIAVKMSGLFGGATESGDLGGGYSGYYVPVHTWTATPSAQQVSVDDLFAALDALDGVYATKPDETAVDQSPHS
jgi:hypothetical protein